MLLIEYYSIVIYFHTEKKIFFYLMKAVSSVIFHIICRKKRTFLKVSYFVCVILLCDYFYVLNSILYLFCTPQKILHWDTICSISLEPIYIVNYHIRWGNTSWTDGIPIHCHLDTQPTLIWSIRVNVSKYPEYILLCKHFTFVPYSYSELKVLFVLFSLSV